MITIQKFSYSDESKFRIAREIRNKVFIMEQQVPPHLEYDHEEESVHYLIYDSDHPVGTARWRKTGSGIKLERFAILPEYRSKGYGTIILQRVLQDVIPTGGMIYLNAQITAVNYYLKAGFLQEGEKFTEAGIEHYKMIYKK